MSFSLGRPESHGSRRLSAPGFEEVLKALLKRGAPYLAFPYRDLRPMETFQQSYDSPVALSILSSFDRPEVGVR